MTNTLNEHEELAKADQAIAESIKRVSRQITHLGWLAKRGQDTTRERALLETMAQALKVRRAYRQLILQVVAQDEPLVQ
jgi:hypothetical protein